MAETILGTGAPDALSGTEEADTILGGAGADSIFAAGGDDLIDTGSNVPGGVSGFVEFVDGGEGIDTVIFDGDIEEAGDILLAMPPGVDFIVFDETGPTNLIDVEFLEASNVLLDLSSESQIFLSSAEDVDVIDDNPIDLPDAGPDFVVGTSISVLEFDGTSETDPLTDRGSEFVITAIDGEALEDILTDIDDDDSDTAEDEVELASGSVLDFADFPTFNGFTFVPDSSFGLTLNETADATIIVTLSDGVTDIDVTVNLLTDFSEFANSDILAPGDGDGELDADEEGASTALDVTGTDEDEFISGNGLSNALSGGEGDDAIFAGGDEEGADFVVGDVVLPDLSSPPVTDPDAGDDVIGVSGGDDTVIGDSFDGLADALDLPESGGNDTIFGGAGDDVILAGSGTQAAVDAIVDFTPPEVDIPAILSSPEALGADVFAGEDGDGDNLVFSGTGDDFILGEDEDTLGGGEGDDIIVGGLGDDVIFGGAGDEGGDDLLFGGDGDDEVFAGAGDDLVLGGEGDDSVFGGAGDDTIFGGVGEDTIFGSAGDDVLAGGAPTAADPTDPVALATALTTGLDDEEVDEFAFIAGHGTDTILGFELDEDQINLADTTTDFADFGVVLDAIISTEFTDATLGIFDEESVLISTGGGDSILLVGIDAGDLDADDFIL